MGMRIINNEVFLKDCRYDGIDRSHYVFLEDTINRKKRLNLNTSRFSRFRIAEGIKETSSLSNKSRPMYNLLVVLFLLLYIGQAEHQES